jgi:hypothetical protein
MSEGEAEFNSGLSARAVPLISISSGLPIMEPREK